MKVDDDDDIVTGDTQVTMTDFEALRRRGGPTAEDLEAMPATTAEDWKDAVVIEPMPPEVARQLALNPAWKRFAIEDGHYPAAILGRLCAGENPIAVLRDYRGLSQAELAGRTALEPAALAGIESGAVDPPLSVAASLARALQVDLNALVTQAAE